MDHMKLWRICICLAIVGLLYCPESYVAQDVALCSPRCWSPVQLDTSFYDKNYQTGVVSEYECKALCANSETCIGIQWDTNYIRCWFPVPNGNPNPDNHTNNNYWRRSDCTDDCFSYCWEEVEMDFHVGPGVPITFADENHCKLKCSTLSNCTGVNWNDTSSSCSLIFSATIREPLTGIRHWDIIRNLPSRCLTGSATSTSMFTPNTVTTLSTTKNPSEDISRSKDSVEGGTNGFSNSLTTGIIIVLAVLLGLCILIITGLTINTIRYARQMKSGINSVELKDKNYGGLQRAQPISGDVSYTDLAQRNPNEAVHVYEQTG